MWLKKLYSWFVESTLWATTTNLLYVSPLTNLLLPFAGFKLLKSKRIHRIALYTFLLLTVFTILAFIYDKGSLFRTSFYRRDGNIFVSLLPVFVIGMLGFSSNISNMLKRFCVWGTIVNAAFMIIFYYTQGTLFFHEPGIYYLLFYAHNAAGGYLSMLCLLCVALWWYAYKEGKWYNCYLIIFLINFIGLWFTKSKGSLTALTLTVVFLSLYNFPKLRFLMLLGIIFSSILIIVYGIKKNYTALDVHQIGRDEVINQIDQNNQLNQTVQVKLIHDKNVFAKIPEVKVNKKIRSGTGWIRLACVNERVLELWPCAIKLSLSSPFFGTGFGSFNDSPYHLEGINHVLAYNVPTVIYDSDAHAHHSFLHILAETGLFGLVLVCLWLRSIYTYLIKKNDVVALALLGMFWCLIFSSFTEHRLFTPSQMLPFTIILGIYIANDTKNIVNLKSYVSAFLHRK